MNLAYVCLQLEYTSCHSEITHAFFWNVTYKTLDEGPFHGTYFNYILFLVQLNPHAAPTVITCGFVYICTALTFRHTCSSIMHITFHHTWPTIPYMQPTEALASLFHLKRGCILRHKFIVIIVNPNSVPDISASRYTWPAYLLEEHAVLSCTVTMGPMLKCRGFPESQNTHL